ncbi:unnamed protein product, partial [Brassica rapa subsp. narinosa]
LDLTKPLLVRNTLLREIVSLTRSPSKLEAMPSPASSEYAEAKIGVFWDVKECPIPAGLDPGSIFRNIKSALAKQGYLGELTIRPYCDKDQFPDGPDDFESAGMKLVPPDVETETHQPVNILLAHPEDAPRWCPKCRKPLEDVVAESGEWFWESLAAGGDSIAKTKCEELLGNTDYS